LVYVACDQNPPFRRSTSPSVKGRPAGVAPLTWLLGSLQGVILRRQRGPLNRTEWG